MEEQAQVQQFFTKKRVLLISIFFLIVMELIVITIIFIIHPEKIKWNLLSDSFKKNLALSVLITITLVSYLFVRAFTNVFAFWIRIRQAKIKIKFWDYFVFAFFYSFILMVSPSSLLSDPYAVFWLRTRGVSLHKASAITINNDFLTTIVAMLLSWPSIIYMAVDHTLETLLNDPTGKIVFIFVFIGMGIDLVVLFILFVFGFSKRVHIFASIVFNKVRKLFRMPYLTKAQIVEKYMKEAIMRQEFVVMLKDFKGSSLIFLVQAINMIFLYICVFLSMELLNDNSHWIHFWKSFSAINVANSANKFIPTPNGQGSMEWCIIELSHSTKLVTPSDKDFDKSVITGGVLIWRIFTTYLPAVVGMSFFAFEIHNAIKRSRHHRLLNKPKDIDPVVEFLDNQIKKSRETKTN